MKRIGVVIGALVTSMAPWTANAQCPLPTPVAFDEATVVPIADASACTGSPGDSGAPIARLIPVTGVPEFLTDIDVRLNIAHNCPGDIQATLTSPQGTIVSLVTNLGGPDGGSVFCFNAPVLAGTTFDDAADPAGSIPYSFNNRLATDIDPSFNAVAPFLVPEEALAAFYGENPNGDWVLTVVDTCAGDSGSLQSWGLDIAALSSPPTEASQTFPVAGGAVPDPGVLVSNVNVDAASAGLSTFLTDVELSTSFTHDFPQNTQLALRSPGGTVVTLSTNNGQSLTNTFNPTLWDDQADLFTQVPYAIIGGNDGLASDHDYSVAPASPLVPEEAMGAFYGQDPNGTWSLAVADLVAGTQGNLANWNLVLTTGVCAATPTPTATPTGTLTPTPTVTPGGPTVTPVGPTPTPTPTIAPKICNGLPATIVGTSSNDLIIGTDGDDVIHSKGGNDEIKGRGGADLLCGGSGNDIVRGGGDADFVKGGSGNDFIKGGGDRDVLLGNKGDDVINGGKDDDTCIDDDGSNTFANCEDVND
jgi:subtilisin-like proprotein convertase family protein